MKKLIEFPLEDGTTILVESDSGGEFDGNVLKATHSYGDEFEGGVMRVSRSQETIEKASQTFEQALERVKPAAGAIIQKLRSLHDAPNEVEVSFGLRLNAEAGAFVASAGVDANYTVTLRWWKDGEGRADSTR